MNKIEVNGEKSSCEVKLCVEEAAPVGLEPRTPSCLEEGLARLAEDRVVYTPNRCMPLRLCRSPPPQLVARMATCAFCTAVVSSPFVLIPAKLVVLPALFHEYVVRLFIEPRH